MKDSYVEITGHDDNKITHSYAFSVIEFATKTLNENFKVNVEDFIAVNFTSFHEIIDKVG
ncbi:LCP family glycopolymer transferase [Clostridium perfringens]